jgi:hypothetical protein
LNTIPYLMTQMYLHKNGATCADVACLLGFIG